MLDEIRSSGIAIAYSSRLVPPELTVAAEPAATEAVAIVREILASHSLKIQLDAGVFLVVRMSRKSDAPAIEPAVVAPAKPAIENITVSASRYEISRDASSSKFLIDRRTIESM